MKFNKILQNIDFTTKEAIGYYLVAFKKVEQGRDKRLYDYIKAIIDTIEEIDRKRILEKIDTDLIANFPVYWTLKNDELFAYAIVVFYTLMNSNREIKEKDIISQLEIEMKLYSARTIICEADKILEKMKNFK